MRQFGAIIDDRMVNEIEAVFKQLGGKPALGKAPRTDADLREAIRAGFPYRAVEEVMHSTGLTLSELAGALGISLRSLQRRRGGRLAFDESDRLYRLARIVAFASYYLGNQELATRWLKRPNRALGAVPLSLVDTEVGSRNVENVLGRIAFGGIS
jgi:putative toxin-antitoxin system antitoxin component (TIGR02293 family)